MKAILLLLFIFIFIQAETVNEKIVFQDVTRTIDASQHISRHSMTITIFNNGNQEETVIHFPILKDKVKALSYLTATENNQKLTVSFSRYNFQKLIF